MLLLLCYIDVPILNCVYLFELNIVTSSMKIDMVRPFFSKPERKKKIRLLLARRWCCAVWFEQSELEQSADYNCFHIWGA